MRLPRDLFAELEAILREARAELAGRVDRVEALAELHALALPIAARERRAISIVDLYDSARGDEQERARLSALVRRGLGVEEADLVAEEEAAWIG